MSSIMCQDGSRFFRAGKLAQQRSAPQAQCGLARVQQFFVVLNECLADHEFIAADRLSIADITAVEPSISRG